jgi:hypothetical protein
MDSCDDTAVRAAAMTYARSNIKRDTRPDAGDKFVRVQEEFHNDSPGHWRRNYDHAHTSPGWFAVVGTGLPRADARAARGEGVGG